MTNTVNIDAVYAVWKRQIWSFLANPLGYVFVLAFVLVAAAMLFWTEEYFDRNIADLGKLVTYMPWLLVVLLPALAMGSWASERELGTEEQLLTLPMSVFDALIGKWLAIATFFTFALLCSLSLVQDIAMLGKPDAGLVFANYFGWWLSGLLFAALSLLASTLVPLPAIAFVLGALLCAGAMMALSSDAVQWFDPFNRGLIPLGGAVIAVVTICGSLGLAGLFLSSRRWQSKYYGRIATQCVIVVAVIVTLINLAVQTNRAAVDRDVTSEGLSSVSPTSEKILKELPEPVTITAFITDDLKDEYALKAKEVENLLKVLEREGGDKVKLEIKRPADSLDKIGSEATTHYGIKPKTIVVNSARGKDTQEIFLGAVVTCGAKTQKIDYFDPGLSVEYELLRSIRTVASPKKKVLGIASTDMKMLGDNDPRARMMGQQSRPDWQVVQEWKKQYDIREVILDIPVGKDVDVLVVPQPSRLTTKQLETLHDYIWEGRPALVFEDAFPFAEPMLASSQPRMPPQSNPMMQQQPQAPPEQGDVKPLLTALGVQMDLNEIIWSDFVPSHEFRNTIPRSIVWSMGEKGGVVEAPATTGITQVLMLYPGAIYESPVKNAELTVKTLITPIPSVDWGKHKWADHIGTNVFGMPARATPSRYTPEKSSPPAMAVEVTGRMKRAYPFPAPEPTPAAKDAPPPERKGVGELSGKPIHVILVSDIDFTSDQFFVYYRNEDNQFSSDNVKFIHDLRNVQFVGNLIDSLVGEEDLLSVRTRRPQRRPLATLEGIQIDTQKKVREADEAASKNAADKVKQRSADFQKKVESIEADSAEEDANVKDSRKDEVQKDANKALQKEIEQINREKEQSIRTAKVEQKREIEAARGSIRKFAFAKPTIFLLLVAMAVFALRLRGERLAVPESRKRSAA